MQARLNAAKPYGQNSRPIQTERGAEFEALADVTRQLKAGAGGDTTDFVALCSAIHRNRLLWTALATDVAGDANGLPKELRSGIFYLSEFVGKHSRAVLKKTESPDALIDINLAVMRGLSQNGSV